MRSVCYYTVIVMCLLASRVHADTIDKGSCYSIDGPANVRVKPNGIIAGSLKDGASVRVVDISDKWYMVEYSTANTTSGCEFSGRTERGWTYYGNLLLPANELSDLVVTGKVILATPEISLFGHVSGVFFGKVRQFNCDTQGDERCHIVLPLPYEVNEYCLSGKSQRNRILNVYFEYGGDDGAWITDIKYEKPLLQGDCIVVDGTIAPTDKPGKSVGVDMCAYCDEKKATYKANLGINAECSIKHGDFDGDGNKEALVHLYLNYAPSYESYHIYQDIDTCKAIELGKIYEMSIP